MDTDRAPETIHGKCLRRRGDSQRLERVPRADRRVGDIVIFKLRRRMYLPSSPFDPSCCDIQYTAPNVPAALLMGLQFPS
ncbi:hypothetical protein Bca52824_084168 [Brassica carinata]|uniref:Uncharacterized protein n=1 Tax=Brassica carinata TaxID=52824 RepID=A0A8X7PN65_BRACI|nr:hypothetical protein Bca52824_084168 [Brassica carinata]